MRISDIDFSSKVPKAHWEAWQILLDNEGTPVSGQTLYLTVTGYHSFDERAENRIGGQYIQSIRRFVPKDAITTIRKKGFQFNDRVLSEDEEKEYETI